MENGGAGQPSRRPWLIRNRWFVAIVVYGSSAAARFAEGSWIGGVLDLGLMVGLPLVFGSARFWRRMEPAEDRRLARRVPSATDRERVPTWMARVGIVGLFGSLAIPGIFGWPLGPEGAAVFLLGILLIVTAFVWHLIERRRARS